MPFKTNPYILNPSTSAGLLVTGQTTSYHTGDDGDLEKGIAHDFTVLATGQHSGTTNITINGKTCALSNNCVKDNNTKLTWARYVPQTNIGAGADGKLFWDLWNLEDKITISFDNATGEIRDSANGFVTAALPAGRKFTVAGSTLNDGIYTVSASLVGAVTTVEGVADEAAGDTVTVETISDLIWNFVDQANTNNLGGYNDWRVPNKNELTSILDHSSTDPSIDTTIFPSTPGSYFWTSSARPADSLRAFNVVFYKGSVYVENKNRVQYYVRLIRG